MQVGSLSTRSIRHKHIYNCQQQASMLKLSEGSLLGRNGLDVGGQLQPVPAGNLWRRYRGKNPPAGLRGVPRNQHLRHQRRPAVQRDWLSNLRSGHVPGRGRQSVVQADLVSCRKEGHQPTELHRLPNRSILPSHRPDRMSRLPRWLRGTAPRHGGLHSLSILRDDRGRGC